MADPIVLDSVVADACDAAVAKGDLPSLDFDVRAVPDAVRALRGEGREGRGVCTQQPEHRGIACWAQGLANAECGCRGHAIKTCAVHTPLPICPHPFKHPMPLRPQASRRR